MFGCFKSLRGRIVLALTVVVAGYLVIWHGAHLAAALPFLVILACPLMHLFMHGGHGSDADHRASHDATFNSSVSRRQTTDNGVSNGKNQS